MINQFGYDFSGQKPIIYKEAVAVQCNETTKYRGKDNYLGWHVIALFY